MARSKKNRMITATYISPCTYEVCILYQVELGYIIACTHFILNKQTQTFLLDDNAELAHAVFHFHFVFYFMMTKRS